MCRRRFRSGHRDHARGVPQARRLGVPVVFGDATRDDTLRAAAVANASAPLLLTSSDVANLEAALHGRAYRDDLRVVLWLFDDDLAERVRRGLGLTVSAACPGWPPRRSRPPWWSAR